jgi:2-polyprenyl-6-hydroxyphenyl methylase/3-demethylubiquinone-9 3-methyltransferase
MQKNKSTIDQDEVNKFSAMSDEWWNIEGKFKPLHKFNPCRLRYINKKIIEHFSLKNNSLKSLDGLKIIDIGCGGGLVAEPIANMGANVIAIDASKENIEIAKIHAKESNLDIDYRQTSIEDMSKKYNNSFDVVLALEIIEHVASVDSFIKECSRLLKPNGLILIATLNRTIKSLITAKFGAEYILKWLPIGTHNWQKFLKPYEILKKAEQEDLVFKEICGFKYNFLKDEWSKSRNNDVNYILVFSKKSTKDN